MWLVFAMLRGHEKRWDEDAPDRVGLVSIVLYGIHFGYCPIYETEDEAEYFFPGVLRAKLPMTIVGE